MIERIDYISDALLVWLITTSIQISIVGLLIALLDRVIENRVWPQVRAALWWLLIVGLVVSPFAKSPISIWTKSGPISKVGELIVSNQPSGESNASIPSNADSANAINPSATAARWNLAKWTLLSIWSIGVAICFAAAMWRNGQVRRRWIGNEVASPAWFAAICRESAAKIGLRRLPRVVISEAAPGPAVVGAIRPVVVVPASIVSDADRQPLEHVLLHEFAHVRRRDAVAGRFCQLVQIVYWFHPIVGLARKQLETLREICCDELVARAMSGEAESYRRTLLNMARTLVDAPTPAAVGFVHPQSQIMARLTHLERPLTNRPRTVRATAATLFAVLLICSVPQVQSLAPRLEPTVANLADLPGCMQLRFAVMRALAEEVAQRSGA